MCRGDEPDQNDLPLRRLPEQKAAHRAGDPDDQRSQPPVAPVDGHPLRLTQRTVEGFDHGDAGPLGGGHTGEVVEHLVDGVTAQCERGRPSPEALAGPLRGQFGVLLRLPQCDHAATAGIEPAHRVAAGEAATLGDRVDDEALRRRLEAGIAAVV